MPMVSVVLPTYNCESYIYDACRSILDQSFQDFELILINDNSTDQTESKIKTILEDKRVLYHKNESNMGICASLNRGIQLSGGRYIARMDADDVSHPDRLRKQVQLAEIGKLDLVGCDWRVMNQSGHIISAYFSCSSSKLLPLFLLYGVPFAHGSAFFRRDFLVTNKLFYGKEFKFAEDYALWIDFIVSGCRYGTVREFLFDYRQMSKSLSVQNKSKIKSDYRMIKDHYMKNYKFEPIPIREMRGLLDAVTVDEQIVTVLTLLRENVFGYSVAELYGLFSRLNSKSKAQFLYKFLGAVLR